MSSTSAKCATACSVCVMRFTSASSMPCRTTSSCCSLLHSCVRRSHRQPSNAAGFVVHSRCLYDWSPRFRRQHIHRCIHTARHRYIFTCIHTARVLSRSFSAKKHVVANHAPRLGLTTCQCRGRGLADYARHKTSKLCWDGTNVATK